MLEDLSYIDTLDFLKSVGIQNTSISSGEISFSCPSSEHFHGDKSPSARMNSRSTAWICHGCGRRGNAITFLAWHKGLDETIARRLLEERYGGGALSAPIGDLETEVLKIMNPEVIEEEERIPPTESWLHKFFVEWDRKGSLEEPEEYMFNRGFLTFDLKHWKIGFDNHSQRITIPINDEFGSLVGFKGRAIHDGPYPKYMILGDRPGQNYYGFQPYQKSKHVFGLDKLRSFWGHEPVEYCSAVLVEGELNVLAMCEHGMSNTIAIAGSEFSGTQRDLIVKEVSAVILFLDNDKAGEKGTKKVIEMLSPYMPIKVVQNAPGDAAELDTQTIKELISSARPVLELQVEGKI